MDDGLLNKPKDDTTTGSSDASSTTTPPASDEVQSKIDEALNTLPGDLEQKMPPPVNTSPSMPSTTPPTDPPTDTPPPSMPTSTPLADDLSKPITPPTTPEVSMPTSESTDTSLTDTPAGLPPLPETPITEEVKPEKPEVSSEAPSTMKPPSKLKRNLKKNGKKILGGALMVAVLLGGVIVGRNVVQQRQQVESEAAGWCSDPETDDGKVQSAGRSIIICKCKDNKCTKKTKKLDDGTYQGLKLKADREEKTVTQYLEDLADEQGAPLQEEQFEINRSASDIQAGIPIYDDQGRYLTTVDSIAADAQLAAGKNKLANLIRKGELEILRLSTDNTVGSDKGGIYTYDPDAPDAEEQLQRMLEAVYLINDDWNFYICDGVDCNNPTTVGFYDYLTDPANCGAAIQLDEPGDNPYENSIAFEIPCVPDTPTSNPPSSPPPGASPSPSVSPPPGGYSCVSLDNDPTTIALGDTVTFSCQASFSGYSPMAYFRYSTDGGANYTALSTAYDLTANNPAQMSLQINDYGNYVVQCRVCTDSSQSNCTTWGQAN
jgi:hypothetical protein